ncbi:MAG: hypothetical protein ACE361_06745 [Aureliella sp.]
MGVTSLLLFLVHGISVFGLIILLIYSAIRFAGNRGIQTLVFFGICIPLFFRVAAPLANIAIASQVSVEAFALISMAISAATSLITPISILLLILAISRAQNSSNRNNQSDPEIDASPIGSSHSSPAPGPSHENPYGPI